MSSTERIHATEIIQPDGTRFVRIGGEWRPTAWNRYAPPPPMVAESQWRAAEWKREAERFLERLGRS